MKAAISIPDPLVEAADELARKLGISRNELFRRAVSSFLAAQSARSAESVTEALNQLYGDEGETAAVDSLLEGMQLGSLPEDDW